MTTVKAKCRPIEATKDLEQEVAQRTSREIT